MKYTTKTEMKYFSPKIVQFLVLMVCGASMMTSESNVTTCSCYGFYNQTTTGTESKINCNNSGGHLVTMETEEEWKFINSEIKNRSKNNTEWYIGLIKEKNAWKWKWLNDKSLTINKWQSGQPSGDGNCVIMATNYPDGKKGLWNDLHCYEFRYGFICEYDQGSDKCSSSKVSKVCFTERSVPTTACTMSDPDKFNLVYVVIALGILLAGGIVFYIYVFYCKDRNLGYSLRCQKYKGCEFKTSSLHISRTSVQMEEGTMPLQNEPTTETEIEDNSNKTDRENSAGLENPAQDTVKDPVDPDYTLPDNPPGSTSTYAALYSSVAIEQKKPEENEDTAPPKMPSPYHKVTEEPAVYATIDKSKKTNKGKGSHVEVVYAKVDKTQKRRNSEDHS